MSADEGVEMTRRLFSTDNPVQPPVDRPGIESRSLFRSVAQGDGPEPAPRDRLLSKSQQAFIEAFGQRIMEIMQNGNITAALPSWNQENLWSTPIDLSAQTTVPAAVGGYTTVLTYKVEPGRWGVIKGYGVDVVSPAGYTYDGSLLWRITVNGVPVQNLFDWGNHRGTVQRPRFTHIILREDWVVNFDVRRAVAAANPSTVDMALVGWTWRPRHNYEGTEVGTTSY